MTDNSAISIAISWCGMYFSSSDIFELFLLLILALCIPILFVIPFLIRGKQDKNENSSFISLVYLEIPIAIIIFFHTLYFSRYLNSTLDSSFNLAPYVFVLWFIRYLRKINHANAKRILTIGWIVFVVVFICHNFYLFQNKNKIDYESDVYAALKSGDANSLNILWKKCPDNINFLFDEMTNNPDYPSASFEKVIQCGVYNNDSNFIVKSSFEYSKNTNLLMLLYKNMTDDEKVKFQKNSSSINYRIADLKQCGRDSKCSRQTLDIIIFLLKLEPTWSTYISISQTDLHNAIMNSNEVNVRYFLKFVKPKNENDAIAMAIVLGNETFVISKIRDDGILFSPLGKEFGSFGENISLLDFIISNGSEKIINFIIDDLNVNVNCYLDINNINGNLNVSPDYIREFDKRFYNKVCANPIN